MTPFLKKIKFFHLSSNLRKIFLFRLTSRRNFIPILSIYFLTFPNSTVKEIGLYTAIGSLMGFLLEIPSGYIADRLGHKTSLIISKLFLLCSTALFLVGGHFVIFTLASIALAIGFAFSSGTQEAFVHETLEWLDRDKEFTKINSRIGGNVSLISVLFIVGLPFLTEISYRVPFWVGLGFDVVGIFVALSLIKPNIVEKIKIPKSIFQIIWELKWKNFLLIALYTAIFGGIMIAASSFREPYLQALWYPVTLIGLVMWGSRLVWFGVARIAHWIEEKLSIAKLMLVESLLIPVGFLAVALIPNPFIVGAIFSILVGYQHGRWSIFTHAVIKIIPDKKYKATVLSVQRQLSEIIRMIMLIWLGMAIFQNTIEFTCGA